MEEWYKMKEIDEKEIEAPYELPEDVNIFELGNVLSYEQPTNYIVESTDYDDSYNTPVLTAGKSFIIGYTNETAGIYTNLPVIIFDDFTTSSQYVDFPFKVKSSAMKILSVNHNIADLKYIYFFMQVVQFEAKNHKRYWISEYSKIKINLPPLSEQKRIVNRIESMFAKLDEAKEKAQNVVDGFETRKSSILHKAFTGELTAKWRKENGVSDDSWEEKTIGECGKWERGRSKHRPRNAPDLFGGKYPFIQTGDIANADIYIYEHKQTLSEFGFQQSRLFPKDTLCITIAANIGKVAILTYDCCFPDSVVGFTPFENVDSKFMYYKINDMQKDLEAMAPATAQKNLNLKLLTSVSVQIPTFPEQVEIVRILDIIIEKENKAKQAAEAVLEQIDLLKKSILARAFRGEL